MRKSIFLLLLISLFMVYSCDESPDEEKIEPVYSFLIGAYTDSEDQGIGLLTFDPEKNILQTQILAAGVSNPSFVVSNRAQTLVFAVEENGGENGGKVKSFKFDRQTNTLELLDTKDTYGDHPCYLSLDANEEVLVVGNYSGGNFSAYKVKDGYLTHVQTYQHEGQSIDPNRQEKAHVHSTVFHPNGKQLLVGDLGTDKIHLYDFNPTFAVPFNNAENGDFEIAAGSGPRHLAVHPSGSPVYLIHEMTAELGVYQYVEGKMSKIQVFPLTGKDFIGNVGAAEVRISPDAKFVYASNRGDANEITVFEIEKTGELTFVERVKTGGENPRNFVITSDGKYLLAGNQSSGTIVVFERNLKTGRLRKTGAETKFHKPVYFYGLD
ncbi:lactonase family protein [Cognataquiflexum aquatile]|uniref:lactonase family protein n=1 Tax=Cognataquiflexum aquatile TaxID=2249427 RepID=UPI000DE84B0A|nr:lactonase family protein [Cognataquiflexum aquatile]